MWIKERKISTGPQLPTRGGGAAHPTPPCSTHTLRISPYREMMVSGWTQNLMCYGISRELSNR